MKGIRSFYVRSRVKEKIYVEPVQWYISEGKGWAILTVANHETLKEDKTLEPAKISSMRLYEQKNILKIQKKIETLTSLYYYLYKKVQYYIYIFLISANILGQCEFLENGWPWFYSVSQLEFETKQSFKV